MSDKKTYDLNVELGPGSAPLLGALRTDLISKGQGIFIDRDPESGKVISQLFDGPENFGQQKFKNAKTLALQGRGTDIPLANNSVGTLLAVNVLGHIRRYDSTVEELVSAWQQKLSENGRIVIFENYTPDQTPLSKIKETFKEKGFKIVEQNYDLKSGNIFEKKEVNLPFVNAILSGNLGGSYSLVFQKK